ncbi:MAG: urate hydroxylase PuuD [Alphaproteobacteria bacterium]
METILLDWLALILRWTHIIVGIAWIGSSFYFMWLDSHLEGPTVPDDEVEGQLWMVHSGGFYKVDKIMVAPKVMPRNLHWFKWEAWWTGVTGVLLLAVVYYLGSAAFLIDPDVADITKLEAVGIGIATLVIGWFLYDGMYMSEWGNKYTKISSAIGFVGLCVVAFGLSQVLSGRAAYVHVGALIGIIMVLNVWIRIIPGQHNLVNARKIGEEPDPSYGVRAKQRSVHNNYLTLPIVFVMISSHYPMTFGHEHSWAILIALFVIGALVRHWFNLRNSGSDAIWPVPLAIIAIIMLAGFVSVPGFTGGKEQGLTRKVGFAEVQAIVKTRCTACHSARPTYQGIDKPPKNIKLETEAEIRKHAAQIQKTTVATNTMPLGNATKMSKEERLAIGQWITSGMPDK